MTSHPSLNHLAHRPWSLPKQKWQWRLSWLDLLFIHQPVSIEHLRKLVPNQLQIEEFDGSAWVSTVPFRMAEMMPKNLPCIPLFRSFPELNVRTYVTDGEKSGVYFFSLDATSWPLVLGARALYGLPYYKATMTCTKRNDWFEYTSKRLLGNVSFSGRYRPKGDVIEAPQGSFEHWAAERYCLYSSHIGKLLRLEVHHAPWIQRRAEVEITSSSALDALELFPQGDEMRCYFSEGVDVVTFGATWL